ncbi:phage tail tape measure protein [Xanthobacter autotrophicus]|uniref:hypothetical protein n=1 Tax=Xanthobacter TaxID=279 RepID=UPI0024AC01EE|nr:hypothetical protein [Xanthobacter autotrophicus]MDI4663677.1 phage tail tape measure protein [Xanthobacter autotrophicus]
MAENDAKLELGFGVDTSTLERGFRRAAQSGDQHLGTLEKRAERAKQRLETSMGAAAEKVSGSIKGIGAAFAGGLLGGFAIGGASEIPNVIRDVTRSLAELKGEAQRAGIDVEQFQALDYAAKQSGVSIDALTDGLKEMQLRADEFVLTGKGSSAEAFQRLGYSADELKEKLKNPVALFDEIIARLKKFETAPAIRIADEVFGGTGGEQFVRFLDSSAKSLQQLQADARGAGVVLDRDIIAKGAEIDKAFQKLSDTIGTRLKGGIVSTAIAFDDFATKVQEFMNSVGGFDFWKNFRLGGSNPDVKPIENEMDRARAELAKRLNAGERFKTDGQELWTPPKYTPPVTTKKIGITGGVRFDADVLKVRDEIAALEAEQAALGKSAFEAARLRKETDLLAQARRDGVEVSPEIKARIDEESRAYATAASNLENARVKMNQARELQDFAGQELTSSLSGLLTGTQTVNDALDNLIQRLIEASLQAALLGSGPLAGLFGGSTGTGLVGALFSGFGGARAGGGDVASGKSYLVGEKGPELFSPGRSGSIVPNDVLKSIRAPSINIAPAQPAPSINFAPTVHVNANGGSHAQNADLAKQVTTGMQRMVRDTIIEEMRRQRRPNGALA